MPETTAQVEAGTAETGDNARNGQTTPATGETSTATTGTGTPPAESVSQPTAATVDPVLLSALEEAKAEAEKWKQQARKNEDRAKANAAAQKELERVKLESLSEQERVVAEAHAAGRTEAMQAVGMKLVHAEFRAASAGRLEGAQLDVLLDTINLGKFLDDEGTVDGDAIKAFLATIMPAPKVEEPSKAEDAQGQPEPQAQGLPPLQAAEQPKPKDIGQGPGRSSGPPALNSDALDAAVLRMVGATPNRRR